MTMYAFLLKIRDRSGAMETVAATFAHRGISLSTILANDGTLAPDSLASVLVTFRTTATRKDAVKATLERLTRVVSVTERTDTDLSVRQCALVRVASLAEAPSDVSVQWTKIPTAPPSNDELWSLLGPPIAVAECIESLRHAGTLLDVSLAIVAL